MHEAHPRRFEESVDVDAGAQDVFAFIDDHAQFSSHMMRPSWRMGGASMRVSMDDQGGRAVGSHIKMDARMLGVPLALDEIVTRRDPPFAKEWETVGAPRLVVVGPYHMGIEVEPRGERARLRVWIDYELPAKRAWLGRLFGAPYARWCVRQMTGGVREQFAPRPA